MVTASNYNVNSIFWTGNATAASPTWQVVEGNITLPSVRSCAIVALNSGVEYYVGSTAGLFSTTNINSTATVWTREVGGPLTTAIVNSLALRREDNTMVVGTHGNGMFAAYLGVNSNAPPSGSNSNFIRTIYPIPSNEIINYQIGDLTSVTTMRVQVLNFAGQLLYDRETGYQNGSVFVGLLPKGVYVLAITSSDGNHRYVNKFVKN
jgi:Secretion system C-terminal sorting domain